MSTVEHKATLGLNRIALGRRIAELMESKGDAYSARSLSARIGTNRETFRLMLNSERRISPSEIKRIADSLGVSVERLKQIDTESKEIELCTILKSKKRNKVMLDRANVLANELVELAMGATEYGTCLNYLGNVQFLKMEYDAAHQTWLKAFEISKHIKKKYEDSYLLNLVSSNLMLSFTVRKEYSNADELLGMVEEEFANDPDKLGKIYYSRMKIEEGRGNIEHAKKHAYRSLEYFEQTKESNQIGTALINVSHYEFLLGNYQTSERLLSSAMEVVEQYEDVLIFVVKEYVKTLMQLRDYQKVIQTIEKYEVLAKQYPEFRAKLQIMYSVAQDDPKFAEAVVVDSSLDVRIRYHACKCLMEYYYLKRDAESAMRYYERVRIMSGTKSEYLNEEGF